MSKDKFTLICGVALATGMMAGNAVAQSGPVLVSGDAVVTGFSGTAPLSPENPTPVIDLDGPSAQVMSLAASPASPNGTATTVPANWQFTAREVGQVFAIAFDTGTNGRAPNIYLGATSLFGLHIVEASGEERLEFGEPGATFMDGQYGAGGSAGSIWRIDGETGEITEFARLPGNSGAGVGDVVFDPASGQFYATDLDNGMIYQISPSGEILGTFDHGAKARPNAGLAAVNDDGNVLDITNPAFDANNPETWAYTQSERRVWGLAVNKGRLYYSTEADPQVWSVGLSDDGGFASDARLEFDILGLISAGPVTDILFDGSDRIYLGQRSPQKASFNFTEFAEPNQASVVRYVPSLTDPDDWEPDPDFYAIGMPPDHDASNGGISLGADTNGNCGATLWSTGGRLVSSDGSADTPADVHGLQGNSAELIRPENVPPQASYFIDYDGKYGDAEKAGHMGDVEVFQPCRKRADLQYPPGYFPPGDIPPPEWPPEFPPPERSFETNLRLTKKASPKECIPMFAGWSCQFVIRVRNTGPDAYFGDILVKDTVPAAPAGMFFGVGPVPPWSCWTASPSNLSCWRPGVLMNPGQYVELKVNVWLPSSYDRCRLRNLAEIQWAPGGTRWNTDPGDDRDGASAVLPLDECKPTHQPVGSNIHRPTGSNIHRPRGSVVHRPRGSVVHRPRGSNVHRPRGSVVHRPRGSVVHQPRGSDVHRPRGSIVHQPTGSNVHRPRGSVVHRPRGSVVHKPRGSVVHRPKGSVVHKPRGSNVHRPKGSIVHKPRGSVVHRPKGSVVHKPRGSNVHRPKGSIVHKPRGSVVHRPKGSVVHKPRGSNVHRPKGSVVHKPRGSVVHRPKGSNVHKPRGSKVHQPKGSKVHRPRGSVVHRPKGSKVHKPRGSVVIRPQGQTIKPLRDLQIKRN